MRTECSILVATKGKFSIFVCLECKKINDEMVAEEEMQQETLQVGTGSSSASTDRVVPLNIKQSARPPIGPPDAPSPPPPAKNPPGKPSRLNLPPPPPPPVSRATAKGRPQPVASVSETLPIDRTPNEDHP